MKKDAVLPEPENAFADMRKLILKACAYDPKDRYQSAGEMKKALEGIKVVDLTSALSGPFCTMMLADYGADVLKIEPLHGDQCRTWGPIDEKSGESGFYCYVNRNKKGATLNLKSEKGKQMFYDLVKDADILVENYRGGVTKKLGIDYETVKKINPSIIYASCSGFGQYGPLTHRACYDIVAQAMGGIQIQSRLVHLSQTMYQGFI